MTIIRVSVEAYLGASVGAFITESVEVSVEPSVRASKDLHCIMYRVI